MDQWTIEIKVSVRELRELPDYATGKIRGMVEAAARAIEYATEAGGASQFSYGYTHQTLVKSRCNFDLHGTLLCGPFATQEKADEYISMVHRSTIAVFEALATLSGDAVELHDITVDWDSLSKDEFNELPEDNDEFFERSIQ